MVVLQKKGIQKSSINIVLQSAAYDAVRGENIIPIQEMNKEYVYILHQNKVKLESDLANRNNPGSSLRIYLTTYKVAQYRLVD